MCQGLTQVRDCGGEISRPRPVPMKLLVQGPWPGPNLTITFFLLSLLPPTSPPIRWEIAALTWEGTGSASHTLWVSYLSSLTPSLSFPMLSVRDPAHRRPQKMVPAPLPATPSSLPFLPASTLFPSLTILLFLLMWTIF